MKNVDIISKVVGRKGEAMASPSKDAASFDLSGYLLKEVWDKCWEIRTTDQGEEYLFGKYPVAVQYGLTSYVDGKMLKLPSIYDGLPIDYQTLYWEEIKEEVGTDEEGNPIYKTTKVLKSKGGNGGNSGGGNGSSFTVDESGEGNAYTSYKFVDGVLTLVKGNEFALESTVKTLQGDFTAMLLVLGQKLDENTFETWKSANEQLISNGNTAWGWGDHSKAGYVDETTLVTALSKYVDLDTPQNISGEKNFTGGLLVKGQKIEYIQTDKDNSKGYWKLEGDLIVSGGITSFASSSGYTPSTIMDAIVCDNQTITIEEVNGVKMLKVIGGSSGSTTVDLTIKYDGSGNAITALSYKDGVFTATRGRTFAAKTGLDAINTRVTALEETIASGGSSSGSFDIGESGNGNAYTSYAYANGKLTLKKETVFATASQLSTLSGTVANKADKSNVYTKTEIDNTLKNYVTVDDDEMQTIIGKKNFTGGLLINNQEIKYNSQGYWELEGDLLVTGGITSFASSSGFTPSTIMDGIVCDEQTITVDVINGVKTLKVIGGGSGTIHWDDIEDAPTSLKNPYALVINGTTYDGSKKVEINISGGSNNTQSIYPLIIKDSSGAKQLTYDPSSEQETLALTKSMVGLGNVENTALSSWEGSNKITTVGTISRGTWQGTPISNNKLANSSIEIAETSVSLGGSITSETLKTKLDIVTLSDGQTITGKKDFTNGLLVNGQELFFDKDERYWKMEGNLLVTGGITSYSSDGKATPFLINVDTWEDILSDSTAQVYSANAVTLLKTGVQSVREDADSALAKLAIIAEELSSLTTSSYTADIRTALMNIATNIK